MTGTIKVVNSKGVGFISTPGNIDYFFHYSDYKGDWKQLVGMWLNNRDVAIAVEFEHDRDSRRGPKAMNVKLISEVTK